MNKIVVLAICGCLLTNGLAGQSGKIEEVLSEIVKNNKQLMAFESYIVSRDLDNRTMNNLDDLEVTGAWLPFGNNSTPDYMEFQVSQSFEFPAAYRVRNQYMDQDRLREEKAYQKERQKILSSANDLCTQIIFQQKRKVVALHRIEQARKVYDQIEELYNREQVGKLDLNKSKIAWMQERFSVEQIDNAINQLHKGLKLLNGGNEIRLSVDQYEGELALMDLNSLWNQRIASDPTIKFLEESEKTALANIAVQKKERLPEFSVGLDFEGFKGDNDAGFFGGLSIPIWNRKSNVKAAEASYVFEQRRSEAVASDLYSEYERDFDQYNYLLNQFLEYHSSLNGLDGEELLAKAHEYGELSYLEYYMELKFYQDAFDEMLNMEQELYLLRNNLLKHTL